MEDLLLAQLILESLWRKFWVEVQLILMVSREASNVLPVEEHEGQGLSLDFFILKSNNNFISNH